MDLEIKNSAEAEQPQQNQEQSTKNVDYGALQPHQQRVVDERFDVSNKAVKLSEFIQGELFQTLSKRQQYLLKKQLWAMDLYVETLDLRISDFTGAESKFTHGENFIGFFGNENWDVFALKAASSTLINESEKRGKDPRRKAIVATDVEKAQMMAVKGLFF